jgi:hypothetical protein
VLFGPHGVQYRHPPASRVNDVKLMRGVTSVQITFHEDRLPQSHSMPPGGFRLAIVNGWDFTACCEARERLNSAFATDYTDLAESFRIAS